MRKGKVFVAMPFEDKFFETFEILKNKFEKDFEFIHAGETPSQQNILKDILQNINDSDVIIADLTGLNPNVFYELGIAHTLNKKVIIITEDINSLPFDLKSYRAKEYNKNYIEFEKLLEYLNQNLHGAISGEIIFSNPVNDFLIKDKKKVINTINYNIPQIKSEKGYLDFIAEIESNSTILENNLTRMTNDIEDITKVAYDATKQIQMEYKGNYYKGYNPVFIREQAKKIATSLNKFSTNLKKYNHENIDIWNKIEKDSFGLLENKFTLQEENQENLKVFLDSLNDLKQQFYPVSDSVMAFKTEIENLKGMEQTLTQAVKFCCTYLTEFLNFLVQIEYSVDRLIDKSKLIIKPEGWMEVEV